MSSTGGSQSHLKVLVSGVDVGDVRLHHVLHQFLEGDFRDPPQLVLRLGAVALKETHTQQKHPTIERDRYKRQSEQVLWVETRRQRVDRPTNIIHEIGYIDIASVATTTPLAPRNAW